MTETMLRPRLMTSNRSARLRLGHRDLVDVEERDVRREHAELLEEDPQRDRQVLVQAPDRPRAEEDERAVGLDQPPPALDEGPRLRQVLLDRELDLVHLVAQRDEPADLLAPLHAEGVERPAICGPRPTARSA